MFLFLLCSLPKVNNMNCEPWEQAGKVVTLLRAFHLFLNKRRYIFSWVWLRHNVSYHALSIGPAPPSIILLAASALKEKTCYYIFWGVVIFPELDDYEASGFLKIYIFCHILPRKISLNINWDFIPNWSVLFCKTLLVCIFDIWPKLLLKLWFCICSTLITDDLQNVIYKPQWQIHCYC